MRGRRITKCALIVLLSLTFFGGYFSVTHAIKGTPGGYAGDRSADTIFDYDVYPPLEAGGGDINWVLGAPDSPEFNPPHQRPYVHLGNGGYVTVQFMDNRIYNGPGDDFRVVEEGLTHPPDESAIVSVSQDGRDFYEIGHIVPGDWRSIRFDLDTLGLDWVLYVKVMDNTTIGDGFDLDAVEALNSQKATTVNVDIKPGSCPNSLNVKSQGVLPVAILGTEDFDVTRIRSRSVQLEGVPAICSSIEDVGEPVKDLRDICACPDDTMMMTRMTPDLSLKFDTQDVISALGRMREGGNRVLKITGELLNGEKIQGMDCVLILGEDSPAVKVENGTLKRLDLVDPSTIADTRNRPVRLISDFIDMEIGVDPPGATATAIVTLSAPAPADGKWFKYSFTYGWIDYSGNAQFNGTRDEVTITLVDGGVGDDDGVANGVIVDPSGLGVPSAAIGGGGGGSGGCFLSTGHLGSFIAR